MAIRIDQLRAARNRHVATARTLNEAKIRGIRTAFLCHSHKDMELALGVEALLNEAGMRLYIDWQDGEMPAKPNQETASRIKEKILSTDFFLFLATANSMASRWCPWEIGFADGKKPINQILFVPTTDGITTHGNEYMDLYRRIDISTQGKTGIWRPGTATGLFPTDVTL